MAFINNRTYCRSPQIIWGTDLPESRSEELSREMVARLASFFSKHNLKIFHIPREKLGQPHNIIKPYFNYGHDYSFLFIY